MAGVVINEFEAVAESPPARDQGGGDGGAPAKIEPTQLRTPVARLARRAERLRAH